MRSPRSQRESEIERLGDLVIGRLKILNHGTEVVDPDGRIRENQFGRTLRRGIFFRRGIVPPREANLRALSRSMRALSASRSNAVFSATPVNSCAMRTKLSSSVTVIRMRNSRRRL